MGRTRRTAGVAANKNTKFDKVAADKVPARDTDSIGNERQNVNKTGR